MMFLLFHSFGSIILRAFILDPSSLYSRFFEHLFSLLNRAAAPLLCTAVPPGRSRPDENFGVMAAKLLTDVFYFFILILIIN